MKGKNMGEARRRRMTGQTTRRSPMSDDSDKAIAAAGGITVPELQELRRRLQAMTSTKEGMERFLEQQFGAGNFQCDPTEDVWVVPDRKHRGPGRGFTIIRPDGTWFGAVVPDHVLS